MPNWLLKKLQRIRELAAADQVSFTGKARFELAALGLDFDDAHDVIGRLRVADFHRRFESSRTREWMYVFKPTVAEIVVYVKVVLRGGCLVISFHEDDEDLEDEESR